MLLALLPLLLFPAPASAVELSSATVGQLRESVSLTASSAVEQAATQVRTTVVDVAVQAPLAETRTAVKAVHSGAAKAVGSVPVEPDLEAVVTTSDAPVSAQPVDESGAATAPAATPRQSKPVGAIATAAAARVARGGAAASASRTREQAPVATPSVASSGAAVATPAPSRAAAPEPKDGPSPTRQPDAPAPGSGGGAGLSSVCFGFGAYVVLAAALALSACGLQRRLALRRERWSAIPFVSALERPG